MTEWVALSKDKSQLSRIRRSEVFLEDMMIETSIAQDRDESFEFNLHLVLGSGNLRMIVATPVLVRLTLTCFDQSLLSAV